jgi:O-antigen/teichoic acid export membrane protein
VIQTASSALGLAVTISWVAIDRSVWALVAGGLARATALAILSHTVVLGGARHRFSWEREALYALYHFGKWIFLSSSVFFLSGQLDRLMLGSYIPMGDLGLYSIAIALASVPIAINMQLARNVMYPSVSRVFREEPHRVHEVFYRARRGLDVMFLPALGLFMGCGWLVVDCLYDPRYSQAGWIFQVLCLQAAMRCILEPCESCLVALGFPRYALIQHCARLVWVACGVPLGFHLGGLQGVVLAVGLCEMPVSLILYFGLHKHRVLRLRREGYALLLLVTGFLVGFAISSLFSGTGFVAAP